MQSYIIRRLILMVPTLLLVTIFTFMLVRFIPGNVLDMMLSQQGFMSGGQQTTQAVKRQLGLDKPIYVQYGQWLGGVVRGDLGTSLWSKRPVTELVGKAIPVSFELGLIAIITALLIALPIGIFSAIRQDTLGDYGSRSLAIVFISVPSFWIGTLVIVYPSIWWGWSPSFQYTGIAQDPGANLIQFLLPGFILGMVMSGGTMRMTRTMMLEVMRQDYIRTAWAKGLNERMVITRHALKNALLPVVTIVGMQVPILIGGSVIIEQIFALPGVGRLMIDAVNVRDYPIVSGINITLATVVLFVNLVVDITYAYLDPRVHYQ